ncbi:hypothetical protein HaLaN_18157 [Haematococcus lacustris]|uniref:Uncharacterized protein n=1 Tax=Haematococcus lacustris TaxID=44745 RepID=A0A699ZRC1_HAELA|nr:hypothetical protein HaLaN_18157 [Haematococcus lacustris]
MVILIDEDNNGIVSCCSGGQLSDEVHADMFPAVLRNRKGIWGCHVLHGVGRCAWVPPGCKAGESPVQCVEDGVRRATPFPWRSECLEYLGMYAQDDGTPFSVCSLPRRRCTDGSQLGVTARPLTGAERGDEERTVARVVVVVLLWPEMVATVMVDALGCVVCNVADGEEEGYVPGVGSVYNECQRNWRKGGGGAAGGCRLQAN